MTELYISQFARRSGGHAVMNWIGASFDSWELINCARVPYKQTKKEEQDWNKDCVIIGLEDRARWEELDKPLLQESIDSYPIKDLGSITPLVIVRDPYSHFASRMKSGDKKVKTAPVSKFTPECVQWWIDTARFSLERKDFVLVNYNRWNDSTKYRKKLAVELELDFEKSEEKKWQVSSHGHGSSFSTTKIKDMKDQPLNERWKEFVNDPRFKKLILPNAEVRELSKEIFGWFLNPEGEKVCI